MIKLLFQKYRSNSILKTGANFSVVSSLHNFVGMLAGILMIRWLEPKEIGTWNAVSIFQGYLPAFLLGIQTGLNLDLPILMGKKDNESVEKYIRAAKWFSFFMAFIFILSGIIASVVIFIFTSNIQFALGVFAFSIIAFSISLNQHFVATYRSSKSFDSLTRIHLIQTIAIMFSVFLIYFFRYYGLLMYNVLSVLVGSLLMYFYSPFNFSPQYNFQNLKKLFYRGVTTMSFYQLRAFAQSIPKILILKIGGIMLLGLYTPVIALNSVMNMLPKQIGQFINPQLGFKYGETGQAKSMWPALKKMFVVFPLFSIPICLLIWFLSPFLLQMFFPKYIDALWPMRIMAVAFVFSSYYMTHGVLYTIKAYSYSYFFSALEITGYFLFPFLCNYLLEYSLLINITIGIALNNLFLFFLNIFILKKVLFNSKYNK